MKQYVRSVIIVIREGAYAFLILLFPLF